MSLGLGMDIVDLALFQQQLDDVASGFVEGSFTAQEILDATHRPGRRPVQHFAARYAAKEAFIKAWSSALWGSPPVLEQVDLREIEVTCDRYQRPALQFHGDVANALASLGPIRCQTSLTHDGGYAAAVVILEAAKPT